MILGRFGVAFRYFDSVRRHMRTSYGARSRGPRVRCLRFAADLTIGLAQDSLPVGDQPLPDGLRTKACPLGIYEEFPLLIRYLIIASPLPRLGLAHRTPG